MKCFAYTLIIKQRYIGMAIFAQPTDTRPGLTLMDRVKPDPIKNRVRFGFFFFKKNLKGVWVFTKTRPGPINIYV